MFSPILALFVEFCTFRALDAMRWPHNLFNSSWKRDCTKKLSSWMISLERTMICWMPISCEINFLPLAAVCISSQLLNNRVNFFVLWYAKGTSCTEIILHIHDNQCLRGTFCCLHLKFIIANYKIFGKDFDKSSRGFGVLGFWGFGHILHIF